MARSNPGPGEGEITLILDTAEQAVLIFCLSGAIASLEQTTSTATTWVSRDTLEQIRTALYRARDTGWPRG